MALNTFGWTPAEVTTDSAGNVIAGVTLTVFTDVTKSNQVTGLFDKDGTTGLPSGVVVSDNKGRFGFKASDAYSLLFVYDGSTADPWPIAAHEALDQGMASHAQAVADAQAAANSAAASAALVGAPAGSAMDAYMGGSAANLVPAVNAKLAATLAPVNVMSEGAVGDGTTDDTTAIKAAITRAKAEKRPLFFPPRTYAVTGQLDFGGLTVDGPGATVQRKAGSSWTLHLIQPTGKMILRGLTFDGNKANTTDTTGNRNGIASYATYGHELHGVTAKNFTGFGIYMTSGATDASITNGSSLLDASLTPSNPALIRDCVATGNTLKGLFVERSGNVIVRGGTYSNNGADGVEVFLCRHAEISSVTANSNGRHGIVDEYGYASKILNNFTSSNALMGVTVGGGVTTNQAATRWVISGNHCDSNTWHGISIDTTLTGALSTPVYGHGVLSGNSCVGNVLEGIYVHNSGYVTVANNYLRANQEGGLRIDSWRCSISGNIIIDNHKADNTAAGLWLLAGQTGTATEYGQHQIGHNVISGNDINYKYAANGWQGCVFRTSGAGSPEGALAMPQGSEYRQTDGASGSMVWLKRSGGTAATGWVAIA